MMMLRVLEKSTLFSTTLRTPTAEIMPYSTRDTPPIVAVGMAETRAENFGQNDTTMANTAAMRMTAGSYTRVSARTPVFSP